MKLLYSFALILLGCIQLTAQSEESCGVVASFTYTLVGNEATFVNTSTSAYDDVTILYHYWYFNDGTQSTEENPTHMFDDPCFASACLTISADSAGYGEEWCGPISYCTTIDLGIDPLVVVMDSTYNAFLQAWQFEAEAIGGSPSYSYVWTLDGQIVSELSTYVLDDIEGAYAYVGVCATDQNGCQACTGIYTINNEAGCLVQLNMTYSDNYFLISPDLSIEGLSEYEWSGSITVNGESISADSSYVFQGWNYADYLNDLGTYEICLDLSEWTLDYLPMCPPTTCETIEVTSLANNCNANFSYTQNGYNFTFVNTSTGYFDNLSWDLGNGIIVDNQNYIYTTLEPGVVQVSLTVWNTQTLCEDTYMIEITVLEPAHICGSVFLDDNQNGIWDAGEVQPDSLYLSWSNVNIQLIDGNFDQLVYPGVGCLQAGSGDSSFLITTLIDEEECFENIPSIELDPNEEWCPIELGIYIPMATFCGTFYNDENANGQMDGSETGIPFYEITVQSGWGDVSDVFTDADGNYCVEIPAYDNWISLTPIYPQNALASISPSSYFQYSYEATFDNINFGVHDVVGELDLGVVVSASNTPSPGFSLIYYVLVENFSDQSSTAIVTLYYDDEQTNTSMSNSGIDDEVNDVVTWDIELLPYQNIVLSASFINATTMLLGDYVAINTNITATGLVPDILPDNDYDMMEQIVIGSYDPNNKLVDPIGIGDEGRIAPNTDEFTYTINFQNTGTAPAVNIVVTDVIDEDLNISTFEMIGATHNVQTSIMGNSIVWTFNNIMLADSFTNEPASHGQIVYRIQQFANLADQTTIENTALIYFDFNEVIVTNTALNTIDYSLSTNDFDNAQPIKLFPNPVSDVLIISGIAQSSIQVFNVNGMIITSQRLLNENQRLDVSDLAPGVYFISVECDGVMRNLPFVKF